MSSLRVTQAGSATWNLDPGSHYWNDPNNWTPATVPSGPNDTATFAASNQAVIALTEGGFEVNGISFPSGASAFAIHAYPHSWLNVSGTGITNNSGIVQNFVAFGAGAGFIAFLNGASAGELTVFTARANTLANSIGGLISFGDSSTAGNGTFYIEGGAVRGGYVPGKILFSGTSTAGNATFMTQGGKRPYKSAGYIQFRESSSAGHGTFITHGSAPSDFNSRASTGFGDTSSGGDAIFVSLGGALLGAFGGNTSFSSSSTAGNATLIAEPGVSHGGSVEFGDSADGGTARVVLFGNGQLDISCHSSPGVTIGSIEKGGNVFLGSNNLTVGSNNLSTAFDGRIQDSDGFCGGSGGSLAKMGNGTLSLLSANIYTGGTTINEGALLVSNKTGSGTGSGAVANNGGTLGGIGTISGPVTIGTTGTTGILAPGKGATPDTLTLQNTLTFDSLANYNVDLNSSAATSDQVIARGVTIKDGASITIRDRDASTLTIGTIFTLISNTASTGIAGTFANLPDTSTVTVGSNTFQANYKGGDGNDLTLTVQ